MRGFIVNTAKENYWRVAAWYDLEDLIQDGYMCYYKCRQRYILEGQEWQHGDKARAEERGEVGKTFKPLPKDNPKNSDIKWFQFIVGRAFHNHIFSLASRHARHVEVNVSALAPAGVETAVDIIWDKVCPPQDEEASLMVKLAEAPKEIKQLLQVLVDDAVDGFRWTRYGRRWSQRRRETTNEYYCRLVGLDPKQVDLVAQIEQYFLKT
jgi:hypothetical protein